MNELPPKIHPGPSSPRVPATARPLGAGHVALGVAGGFLAGVVAASIVWFIIAMSIAHHAQVGVQTLVPPSVVPTVEADDPADRGTIAEIDAASQLSFENNKLSLFEQIAARPNLSPAAQAHLAEVSFKQLSFENNQVQLALKLIGNPGFSPACKDVILRNLGRLHFENNKQALLEALNRREAQNQK